MVEDVVTDALGNPIVIGSRYGYSTRSSGWTTVTIGKAEKVKTGKVRLIDCEVKRYLYNEPTNHREGEVPKYVDTSSNIVFPVNT